MPITNQPNLAALQAAIVQAITDSQTAVIANTDTKTAAVAQVVVDETGAAATALTGEIATKATETQAAVDAAATATQGAITAKGVIKSIQRGAASIAGDGSTVVDVTISAVQLSKSLYHVYAKTNTSAANSSATTFVAQLTSATTLRVTRGTSIATQIEWQVVEYE